MTYDEVYKKIGVNIKKIQNKSWANPAAACRQAGH